MIKIFTMLFALISTTIYAQETGVFSVGGDFDKFYPVTFSDGGWDQNIATELEIGRSGVHYNSNWRGSMMAKLRFHNTRWGNGSSFVNADIYQIYNSAGSTYEFLAGWVDATANNASYSTIIWLRGGGTSYYYKSNVIVTPIVYDGVQNALPLNEHDGPNHNYKTAVDSYVNSAGISVHGTGYFNGSGANYFAGKVGIGTTTPAEKLSVNGNIRAREVKVENANWPDYVFQPNYDLLKLSEVKTYIDQHHHLPDVPSAAEVEKEGISLGEMNSKLLKKIEELTLHLIDKDQQLSKQEVKIKSQDIRMDKLETLVNSLINSRNSPNVTAKKK